jgi:hypothetical protein
MNTSVRLYYSLLFFLLLSPTILHAQLGGIGNKLKQMATSTETQEKAKKLAGDKGAKEKARLDSVDFQYAISINENAGFFNVNEKG